MTSGSEAKDFLQFIKNDAQLKAFGQCVQQVDLLTLDPNARAFNQRPNRTALVVDGECCLDRFYGGYFPDWSCGGQWQNMMSFLSALFGTCHQANVHMAIFYNGAKEADRFPAWVQGQIKIKQNVNQVIKHLTKRMTPPPKAFWVPPCGLKTMLRLAIKSLNGAVHNSLDDHHLEIMSYCWENGYHGIVTDNGEFAFFNPPRIFSAHELKLSFCQELVTTEWIIDEAAKSLDLNPNRLGLVAALLGCQVLKSSDLKEFHEKLVPEMKGVEEGKYRIGSGERIIRAVINYVRALPSVEDFAVIAKDVFGQDNDPRTKHLRQSVRYFFQGGKEGHTQKTASNGNKANSSISTKLNFESKAEPECRKSKKEADLMVERIALDLDQLDINKSTVKATIVEGNEVDLIRAVASGTDVKASAEGKYPEKESSIVEAIVIPTVPPEVKRTSAERHRQGQMCPYIYQILTKGEIKLPVVLESENVQPRIHVFYQPLRQRVYGILCNLHHSRFNRRTIELKVKGKRQKADELFKKAKKSENEDMKIEATEMMKEANAIVLPELQEYVIHEWQPYNDYKSPIAVKASDISCPMSTVQRLWFGTSPDDKKKRFEAFLACMHCEHLQHGKLFPHLIIMATVLRYMFIQGSDCDSNTNQVLRKPEVDAFLATAISPELYNVNYLAGLKLEMVTIRGVHLAALFMQGVEMALMANDACGSPIAVQLCMPWTFFDGKLFHSKLIKATQARNLLELCDGRSDMAYQIEQMRNVILAGLVKPQTRVSLPNAAIWRAPKKNVPIRDKVGKTKENEDRMAIVNEDTADVVIEKES